MFSPWYSIADDGWVVYIRHQAACRDVAEDIAAARYAIADGQRSVLDENTCIWWIAEAQPAPVATFASLVLLSW